MGSPPPGRYRATCLGCRNSFKFIVPVPGQRPNFDGMYGSPITSRRDFVPTSSFARSAGNQTLRRQPPPDPGLIIDCPMCREKVDLGDPSPGKYKGRCPECRRTFNVFVPNDPASAIRLSRESSQRHATQRHPLEPSSTQRTRVSPIRPPGGPRTAQPFPSSQKPQPTVRRSPVSSAGMERTRTTRVAPTPAVPAATAEDLLDFTLDSDEGMVELAGAGKFSHDEFSLASTDPTPPAPGKPGEQEIPERLGGYEVLKVLGRGGMGAVLLGRQVSLDRKVALKVMHPAIARDPCFVARFTREAYAAAQMTHHNIVQIYDIGEEKGQHFFSMEFVKGQSLLDLIRTKGKLAPEAAVGYALQAARGLRQGHNQGMVHRDIKPANLLLNDDGIVKVADLGLVKLPGKHGELETAGSHSAAAMGTDLELTTTGFAVGTPSYMAPEQATNSAGVDARADIYSLGCTLYALLTGKPPFEGRSGEEILSKHLSEPVIPPEVIVKRVPKALSEILMQMLAKHPNDRFQSMDEVIAALEGFLGLARTESFSPSEEQADQLEACVNEYNKKSSSDLKWWLSAGFFLLCFLCVVAGAFKGRPQLALGALAVMLTTPLTYFVVHGVMVGSVVFSRFRSVLFGMRIIDWLMLFGGGLLLGATIYLFGLIGIAIASIVISSALAFLMISLVDLPRVAAQKKSLEDARSLFRKFRLQGLSEDALQAFVCKYSNANWEPFFEAIFGFEAKLAARIHRKGNTGENSRKHASWREPLVAWADARIEARRHAREREHLRKMEAKSLEAEGLSKSEAAERAAAMAIALVDQAAEAKKARKEGREADLRNIVSAARNRRPPPGYDGAGKRWRNLWFRTFLDEWVGRRLRFAMGAFLFAAGLLWMNQNHLLTADNPIVQLLRHSQFIAIPAAITDTPAAPLALSGVPTEIATKLSGHGIPITGLALLTSAAFFFGWRSSIPAIAGAGLILFGPQLGLPEVDSVSPELSSLLGGLVIIMAGGWLLRK